MQDWDFPHFTNTLDVNLPGFHKHMVNFQAVEIQISGNWYKLIYRQFAPWLININCMSHYIIKIEGNECDV